jgi:hypothetical protein
MFLVTTAAVTWVSYGMVVPDIVFFTPGTVAIVSFQAMLFILMVFLVAGHSFIRKEINNRSYDNCSVERFIREYSESYEDIKLTFLVGFELMAGLQLVLAIVASVVITAMIYNMNVMLAVTILIWILTFLCCSGYLIYKIKQVKDDRKQRMVDMLARGE